MVNGPFTPGNGRIAADLFDFRKHVNGNDFNHNAVDIHNSPGVGGATNVQGSIDNINTFIASMAGAGIAFMAVPDGYNSYTNPAPNFYFSNIIPALDTFLNPLFAALAANTGIPAGYERLTRGGVIFIPAGTYYIVNTIDVPPGITIYGEGLGTKIINATCLNLALSPPQINGLATPIPLFKIKTDTVRTEIDNSVDTENKFMFARASKIVNVTICDNFIEPTLLGDVFYGLPQNVTGESQLIMQEQGSHLEIDGVKILGRALNVAEVVSSATRFAVKLDVVTTITTGTFLKITNSFIDGFSQPISFNSTGGRNDYLEVSNCKIRSHGYLDADGATVEKNCIIHMNDNNALISDNEFYGNHAALTTLCYIKAVIAAPPAAGDISNINIVSNNFIISKAGALIGGDPVIIDAGISATFNQYSSFICNGNLSGTGFTASSSGEVLVESRLLDLFLFSGGSTNIDSTNGLFMGAVNNVVLNAGTTSTITAVTANTTATTANITVNAANIITPANGGSISLDGALYLRTKTISSTPYSIDAGGIADYIILVDLTTIAANATIILPEPTLGRNLIIKDRDGLAGTYNIIVSPGNDINYSDTGTALNLSSDASHNQAVSQSFTAINVGKLLTSCKFLINKVGSPTGNMTASIYAHSGVFGTSSVPTGAALATSDVVSSASLSGSPTLTSFTFSGANQISLTDATNYVVVLSYSGGDITNYVEVINGASGPAGNLATYSASTWSPSLMYDLIFNVITGNKLETLNSAITFSANFGSWEFIANGTDWYMI
jgi:hypothetical protein